MRVGIPREVKEAEHRVAITPAGARELSVHGHEVLLETGAGHGSALADDDYARAGATVVPDTAEVWGAAQLVLKVKEPEGGELAFLRPGLTLFTFLHLAASKSLTDELVASGCTAVAYETVEGPDGSLPLLAPMSEIAGRMAAQVGAHELQRTRGGRGVLMGGVPGVAPAAVVVLGAGSAGRNAARVAAGMQASVTVLDLHLGRLRELDWHHHGRILTLASNRLTLEEQTAQADLVIGAVLVPGARAPLLITEEMVARMRPGAVLVDVSVDQGGCAQTSRMTTHGDPTYVTEGVVHYCVGNMPAAVPRTSTYALTNATLPYAVRIADAGIRRAAWQDRGLAQGINVMDGHVTNAAVAGALGMACRPTHELLRD